MCAVIQQITNLAASVLRTAIDHGAKDHGLFRLTIATKIDGKTKPVLVVGNAHANFNDGYAIVVLNPDSSLSGEIKAGAAYRSENLREMALGRCDALVEISVTGKRSNSVSYNCIYQAQISDSAKFVVA